MHLRLIASALVLTAVSFTASCSGDSIPSFEDPLAAMDYAESSMAENKFDHAEAAFEYALANGDDSLSADALQGIYSAQTRAGQEEKAVTTFKRICTEQKDGFDGERMLGLLDMAITSQMADLSEDVMVYTYRNFEDLAPKLILPSVEIAMIRMESGGDNSALEQMGYIGGAAPTEIPDDQLEDRLKHLDEFIRIIEQQRIQAAADTSK